MILGIDPGPDLCGLVLYDPGPRRVVRSEKNIAVAGAIRDIDAAPAETLVAIERVQSYGISGSSLLRTSESVGRLWAAAERSNMSLRLIYRREVLRALDIAGKGSRDALVRQRLIEMHGGTRSAAIGTKGAPGPLYGVASHAWAALAVAIVGWVER